MSRPHGTRPSATGAGRIRIVGGKWRGRRLRVPSTTGVRPTSDRVRETLFNWLTPSLPGARCLDLFAGSGALAFEALSRGAAEAVLVERDRRVVTTLRAQSAELGAGSAQIELDDALTFLRRGCAAPFDLIFLDPPFADELLAPCCTQLLAGGWLTPNAQIYLEADRSAGLPPLPSAWHYRRQGRAGQAVFALAAAVDPSPVNQPRTH